MKLALAITTPEVSGQPPVALLTGSFEEKLHKARALGYDGVELMTARPGELDVARVRKQLRAAGLEAAAVASGPIFMMDGLTLLADSPEKSRRAAARLDDLIDLAAGLGAPVATVGSFRGRLAWSGVGGRAYLVDLLGAAAQRAADPGVRLALEPLNRYEADLIQTAAEGLELIAEVGSPALGLLLDTFHMNIEEVDFAATLRRVMSAGRLVHVHLGDSNRLPPGQGHFDFAALAATLQEIGYAGFLSAELLGKPDPDSAAAATIQHMRPLITGSNE